MTSRRDLMKAATALPIGASVSTLSSTRVSGAQTQRSGTATGSGETDCTRQYYSLPPVLSPDLQFALEDKIGGSASSKLLGVSHPRTWSQTKSELHESLVKTLQSRKSSNSHVEPDPIIAWLETFSVPFDRTASRAVLTAGKSISVTAASSSSPPQFLYEPQLYETWLQSAVTLLDRCLQYRREMGSFEVAGVKAALDYLTFIEVTPIQRELVRLSNDADEATIEMHGQTCAANSFAHAHLLDKIADGWANQAYSSAQQAASELSKQAAKFDLSSRQLEINVSAQLAQFTRYVTPGSASNYAERYVRCKTLLIEDLSEAYTKLFYASSGVASVLGLTKFSLGVGRMAQVQLPLFSQDSDLDLAIPKWVTSIMGSPTSVSAPDVLDAMVIWTRGLLRAIEKVSQTEIEFTIPFITPAPDSNGLIQFTLQKSILPAPPLSLCQVRLVGIGLSALHDSSDAVSVEYQPDFPNTTATPSQSIKAGADGTIDVPDATEAALRQNEFNVTIGHLRPKFARLCASIQTPSQILSLNTMYSRPPIVVSNIRIQGGLSGDLEAEILTPAACRNVDPFAGQWVLNLNPASILWDSNAGNINWVQGLVLQLRVRAQSTCASNTSTNG